MVSALDSGTSGLGSSLGRGHCVLWQDTLLSRCLSPTRCFIAGGKPCDGLVSHRGTLLASSTECCQIVMIGKDTITCI